MLAVLLACTLKVIFSAKNALPADADLGETETQQALSTQSFRPIAPPDRSRPGTTDQLKRS